MIERLECRIAPANLINPRTIAYTDVDGDDVTITFSRDMFSGDETAQLALANQVFKFDLGDVAHSVETQQQLRLIDFTKFPVIANKGSTANGVGISIVATQKGTGDGFADVGAIKAVGVSLGKVLLDGDLGQIDAGGSGLKIGLAALTVQSIGKRGINTQIPVPAPTAENPAPDLVSTITGEVTSLVVIEDVKEARIRILDGRNPQQQLTTIAKLGRLEIHGSLLGRTATETASDDTGFIECQRDILSAIVGTDASDGIIGGGGANSGRISAGGKIANFVLNGSLVGGASANSGAIMATNGLGKIRITGDVAGGLGDGSGTIRTFGKTDSLLIEDDLLAGVGPGSGVVTGLSRIGRLEVKGDIDGRIENVGAGAGGIFANGILNAIIGGSIFGGIGARSGFIESTADIGNLAISGTMLGGAGDGSGSVVGHASVKSIVIKGDLVGGAGKQSGMLRSGFDAAKGGGIAAVTITGKIHGGGGDNSGSVMAGGELRSLKLGSAFTANVDVLKGGAGHFSGTVLVRGLLRTASISGHVHGGDGTYSGAILAKDRVDSVGEFAGDLGTVKVVGHLAGGAGAHSGTILADGGVSQVLVAAIAGGGGSASGNIETGLGFLGAGDTGLIRIGGDLEQVGESPGAGSASVVIGGELRTAIIGGDTTGAAIRIGENALQLVFGGNVSNTVISALGQAVQSARADVALGNVLVSGSVTDSSILAGYALSGLAANPDAQIRQVRVGGNWSASNLVAGVAEGSDAGFGNALDIKALGDDNAAIVSAIGKILIAGTVSGAAGESFGFVAQLIGGARFGSTALALDRVPNGQVFEIGGTGSGVNLREIAVS